MRTVKLALFTVILCSSVITVLGPAEARPTSQGCAQVVITTPAPGDTVRGTVTIEGSATIGDFQFYKVEYSTADQPEFWRAVSTTYRQPVIDGVLDRWNTTVLPDGIYHLRLTAVDIRGQEVCHFFVRNLKVANQEPTATPTPVAPPTLPGPSPTATRPATATPAVSPTPTATAAPILPTRQPQIPLLSELRETARQAFDVERLRDAFLLGAATTTALFVFIGALSLIRRLL